MDLTELANQIADAGWDSRHVSLDDLRYLRALSLPALPSGSFPTPDECEIGISLRETGAKRVIAIAIESRYKTAPMPDVRSALGRLRANAKTLDALASGAGEKIIAKLPRPPKSTAPAVRYAFKLEAIGDNEQSYLRDFERNVWTSKVSYKHASWRLLKAFKLGYTKPWVARITGVDPRYGFAREFLRAEKDYSNASGTGSRGIMLYYWLEPGVYEINERLSWKNHRRYFAQIIDHQTLVELTKDEVLQWIQQSANAS